jgi:hypothetical protein
MIKIFVGCAGNNEDLESQAVLHWSLQKNASEPFVISFMQLSKEPDSLFYSDGKAGWQISEWTTPFSGFRWAVPELCGFEGSAIYMDSDVIVRGDIARLWNREFEPGKIVIAKGSPHPQRLCVSKWNCAAAKNWLPRLSNIRSDLNCHRYLMRRIATDVKLVQPFGELGNWNALDIEPLDLEDESIQAIHYTGIPTHLGLKYAIPRLAAQGKRHWFTGIPRSNPNAKLQVLFDELLVEAIEAGFQPEDYIRPEFGKYTLNRYPT